MDRYLFIAEKPSLSRDIQTAYNKVRSSLTYEADFMALHGHFMELEEPGAYKDEWVKWNASVLPMIPDNWKFKIKSGCESDYNKIKATINSGKYNYVVNACDAGREGQAIFWTIYNHMGCSVPVKRIWASDNTVPTLGKALSGLLDEETGVIPDSGGGTLKAMKQASLDRMYFDWLVGMNLTRAISIKTNTAISVGRVMTPTLAMVVKRDLDIANFVAKDFYEVVVDFDKYKGTWFNKELNQNTFDKLEDAENLIKKLGNKGVLESMDTEKQVTNAPALYSLTELQKEASKAFGFTASKTLDLAQKCYEDYKILSYPRTESRALSENLGKEIDKRLKAIKDVPDVSKYVNAILADKPRIDKTMANKKYVDNKKITDHHAIIPTETVPNFATMKPDEIKLYTLVVKKFVAIFMDPYVTNKTTMITDVSGEKFKTTGTVLVDKGFKELYGNAKKDDVIPKVSVKEEFDIKDKKVNTKTTTPPSPYTDGDLINAMSSAGRIVEDKEFSDILKETEGIGTTATRAGIIEKLLLKKMTIREKVGKGTVIRATPMGIKIIKTLEGRDIISPVLTAKWEGKLRDIEALKLSSDDFDRDMLEYVKKQTEDFLKIEATFDKKDNFKIIGKCPACGGDIIATDKYYMCKNFKKEESVGCKVIIGVKTGVGKGTIKESEILKVLNGEVSNKIKFFNQKTGKQFECPIHFDKETKRIKYYSSPKKIIGKCPACGGDMIATDKYYRCENYGKENGCSVITGVDTLSGKISEEDILKVLKGEKSKPYKFKNKAGKVFECPLYYNDAEKRISFFFEERKKGETLGICPKCGKPIVDMGKYASCEGKLENTCDISFSYNIKGVPITKKDISNILDDKETDFKKFPFGEAKVRYNKALQKIEFIFKKNK